MVCMHIDIDTTVAQKFLDCLGPGDDFTFQTFDDADKNRGYLVRVLHGKLATHQQELCDLNNRGAGIFVTVNRTDLQGRSAKNIIRLRSYFIDVDDKPVPRHWPVEPDIITQRTANNWHAYWLANDDNKLDDFVTIQKTLARYFKSDSRVCDLCRVMRLPGFLHKKDETNPQKVELVKCQPPDLSF